LIRFAPFGLTCLQVPVRCASGPALRAGGRRASVAQEGRAPGQPGAERDQTDQVFEIAEVLRDLCVLRLTKELSFGALHV
jgi:hypothetical protein